MGKLFGTDGVRGVANKELTTQLAFKLGMAGAHILKSDSERKPKIVVGMDTRISGGMIESALISGICSVGANVISVGVMPTPAIAYLTKYSGADAGIVISASHNPFEFNGIKFFNSKGYKLDDSLEEKIEELVFDDCKKVSVADGKDIGWKQYDNDASLLYEDFLKQKISSGFDGLKIAVDCANGATFKIAPKVLKDLGANVLVLSDKPNGININKDCGSTHMKELQEFVVKNECDLGLAFDGDGDRVLAVDELGRLVDGDKIMAIMALDLKNKGKLPKNTVVATVMSNLGLDLFAREHGIDIQKTKVGDRYVLENMLENGFSIGGEQSGHIILTEHNTTGDGPLTGIMLCEILKNSGKTISELASVMEVFPQVLENARVSNHKKYNYLEDEVIKDKCKALEDEFEGDGRVLIRPSGTEPLVRVMIEGKDEDYIEKRAKELAGIIEQRLG